MKPLIILLLLFFNKITLASELNLDAKVKSLIKLSDQIIGIEVLIAEASNNEIASQFGHAMLRFVMNGDQPFNDPVIGFIYKSIENEDFSFKKGFLGDYSSTFTFYSLGSYYLSYINYQERPINRFIIPTTKEIRNNILKNLLQLSLNPDLNGNYWIIGKNCADDLFNILNKSGIPTSNPTVAIPTLVNQVLKNNLIIPLPSITTSSPLALRNKITDNDSFKNLTTKELQLLFYSLNQLSDFNLKNKIHLELKNRNDKLSLQEIYNLNPLSPDIYQLCLNNCDLNKYANSIKANFKNIDSSVISENAMSLDRAWRIGFSKNRKVNALLYQYNFRLTQKIICESFTYNKDNILTACYR